MSSSSLSASRKIAWMVWLIASIFYAYQYILRVMPNILLEDIMRQFNMSAASFGQFSGFYYIGYSLIHLPVGMMLDRFGPKKIMPICILLTVIGLFPLLFSDYWVFPILGRLLIGIGSSAAILSLFKIIRMTFQERHFPRMLSLSVTIGLIGAIYGGGPVSYMRAHLGYHSVLELFACIGLALALTTFLLIPKEVERPKSAPLAALREILSNRRVILSCICAGCMVGPLEGFADVWGTAFLKHVYGLETALASSLPSMIFMGMCFGAPLLSFIAEKAKNYIGTIIGTGLIMALAFFAMLTWEGIPILLGMLFLIIGICCAYQILAIYKISTYVPASATGLTTAMANMIIMIFGYAFHAVMGGVINFAGGPLSAHALSLGVGVIPVALCIGTGGFFLLIVQERRQREKNQQTTVLESTMKEF